MRKTFTFALMLALTLCVTAFAAEPTQSGVYDLAVSGGYTLTPDTAASTDEITISGGTVENFFPGAEKFTLSYSETDTTNHHMVFVLSDNSGIPTESNLVYIDQTTAGSAGTVDFTVYPSALVGGKTYYIYVVGTDLAKTQVASFSYYAYEAPAVTDEASFNGVAYQTFALALTAAQSAGSGTVTLLSDVTASGIRLADGITLDLNGKTLACSYLIGFNGCDIVDGSTGKTGLLKCARNALSLGGALTQIPIWNGTDGYFFEPFALINKTGSAADGTYTFIFRPEFATAAREAIVGANGGDASGIEIRVRLFWNAEEGKNNEKYLVYKDEFVKQVCSSNKALAFRAYITGYESYVAQNLKIQVVVVSDFGTTIASEAVTVQ